MKKQVAITWLLFVSSLLNALTGCEKELIAKFDFVSDRNGAVKIDWDKLEDVLSVLEFQPTKQGMHLYTFAVHALRCFYATEGLRAKKQYAQAAYLVSMYLNLTETVPDSIRGAACSCLARIWRENMMGFVRYGVSLDDIWEKSEEELCKMGWWNAAPCPRTTLNYWWGKVGDSLVMGFFLPVFGSVRLLRLSVREDVARYNNRLSGVPCGTQEAQRLKYDPDRVNECHVMVRHYVLRATMLGSSVGRLLLESMLIETGCDVVPEKWEQFCQRYPEQELPDPQVVREPTDQVAGNIARRAAWLGHFPGRVKIKRPDRF